MASDDDYRNLFAMRNPEQLEARVPEWLLKATDARGVAIYALLDISTNRGAQLQTRETLSEALGCSLRTLARTLAQLQEIGAIRKVRNFNGSNGQQSPTQYLVNSRPPITESQREFGGDTGDPPESLGVTRVATTPRDPSKFGGDTGGDNPPLYIDTKDTGLESSSDISLPSLKDNRPEKSARDVIREVLPEKLDPSPPRQFVARFGKEAKKLLEEGQPFEDVVAAGKLLWEKGLSPALLPTLIVQARNSRPADPNDYWR